MAGSSYIMQFARWLVVGSSPPALCLRFVCFIPLQWYFGRWIWIVGTFFAAGVPLRNIDNLVSNYLITKPTPGPFLAKASRTWKSAWVIRGSFQESLLDAHRRYGHVVQIGPNEYSLDDPIVLDQVYRGPSLGFRKADWYSCCTPPQAEASSLFSVRDRHQHQHIRRFLNPYYRKESIDRYKPLLEPCLEELQQHLDDAVKAKKAVNLADLIMMYAFDAIGRITTNTSFGGLRGDAEPIRFLDALHIALKYFAVVGDYPEWHPYIFAVLPYLGPLNGLRVVNEFIGNQIQHRLQKMKANTLQMDMMSDFMPYAFGNPDPQKAFESMRHLCETNILPGADTTATAICAVLMHVSRSPQCLERLRTELDAFRAKKIADPDTKFDLRSLPYFDAVVKEAMRLHPPIGMMNPRVVPEGGATISGHYFKGGSIVGLNAFVLHHNESVWGQDHEEFRPERWLAEDKPRLERALLAWGAGSRECIGKHIAMLEISRTVEVLVSKYDFEIKEEDVAWSNFQFTPFSKMNSMASHRVG